MVSSFNSLMVVGIGAIEKSKGMGNGTGYGWFFVTGNKGCGFAV